MFDILVVLVSEVLNLKYLVLILLFMFSLFCLQYLEDILKDLTPDDVRHLIQWEDELTQAGR